MICEHKNVINELSWYCLCKCRKDKPELSDIQINNADMTCYCGKTLNSNSIRASIIKCTSCHQIINYACVRCGLVHKGNGKKQCYREKIKCLKLNKIFVDIVDIFPSRIFREENKNIISYVGTYIDHRGLKDIKYCYKSKK